MFTAFSDQELKQAIANKDYERIKTCASGVLASDPLFKTGQMETLLKILHANIPQVFDPAETHLPREYRLPEEQWDEDYYYKLTYWLEDNFVESRLAYIKQVGQKVFQEQASHVPSGKTGHISDGHAQGMDASTHPTQAPEQRNRRLLPLLAILAGIVVLVLVLVVIHQVAVE